MALSPINRHRLAVLLGRQQMGITLTWVEEAELRNLMANDFPSEAQSLDLKKLGLIGLGLLAAWALLRKE